MRWEIVEGEIQMTSGRYTETDAIMHAYERKQIVRKGRHGMESLQANLTSRQYKIRFLLPVNIFS